MWFPFLADTNIYQTLLQNNFTKTTAYRANTVKQENKNHIGSPIFAVAPDENSELTVRK